MKKVKRRNPKKDKGARRVRNPLPGNYINYTSNNKYDPIINKEDENENKI